MSLQQVEFRINNIASNPLALELSDSGLATDAVRYVSQSHDMDDTLVRFTFQAFSIQGANSQSHSQDASRLSTMNPTNALLTLLLVATVPLASAFAPAARTFRPSSSIVVVQRAGTLTMSRAWNLRMSSENEGESDQVTPSKTVPTSGTFYDDEVSRCGYQNALCSIRLVHNGLVEHPFSTRLVQLFAHALISIFVG